METPILPGKIQCKNPKGIDIIRKVSEWAIAHPEHMKRLGYADLDPIHAAMQLIINPKEIPEYEDMENKKMKGREDKNGCRYIFTNPKKSDGGVASRCNMKRAKLALRCEFHDNPLFDGHVMELGSTDDK